MVRMVRMKTLIGLGVVACAAALAGGAAAGSAVTIGILVAVLIAAVPHFLTGLRTPAPGENPALTVGARSHICFSIRDRNNGKHGPSRHNHSAGP
mgnify:CR=1 FL=1